MSQAPPYVQETNDGIFLTVYVQPKASFNKIVGLHNSALKVSLTAPPTDNKANKGLIAFLAKQLHVAKSNFNIVSGHQNRTKRIHITADSTATVKSLLDTLPKGK